jgi:fumarate hydratase class II
MPPELLAALALTKRACAQVNLDLGLLPAVKAACIALQDRLLPKLRQLHTTTAAHYRKQRWSWVT